MYQQVALIHTPCYEIASDRLEPPLGLLYLATVLNLNGYPTTIVDLASVPETDWVRAIPEADVYGFDTFTPSYARSLQILRLARNINPAALTLAGGPHASALPGWVARDFDFVVVGEGEQRLVALLRALNAGERPEPIQYEMIVEDLDRLPFPDYRLVELASYRRLVASQPSVGIISSRGCPYRCAFCTSTIQAMDRRIRYRSPENFAAEVGQLRDRYGLRAFKIQDDVFTLSLKRIREIAGLLAPLGVVYRSNARVDLCAKPEMPELLFASGCRHITFGVESGSPRMLEHMGKRHTVDAVRLAIRLAKAAWLIVRANLMIGFPGETWETMQETIELMLDCQPHEYVVSAFVPYPGTDPYQHPASYGIQALETDFSEYFLLRRDRGTSYTFHTADLNPQYIAEMRAHMIESLSPYMTWAGDSVGYS